MLTEVCTEIKNYFSYRRDRHAGEYKIVDGQFVPRVDLKSDYFAVFGSMKNNGVHKVSDNDLIDEDEFTGAVWVMTPPAAFLSLVDDIEAWQAKYGATDSEAMSPFNSESFGGYSYTKSTGAESTRGSLAPQSWQSAFANRLCMYRRARLQ